MRGARNNKGQVTVFIIIAIVIVSRSEKFHTDSPYTTNQASFLGNHFSSKDTIIFDDDEFEEEMNNLHSELDKLKDIDIHINFDSLNDEMKKLAEELKNLKLEDIKIDFDFDADEFNENMHKLANELKEEKFAFKDFDIDMSDFNEKMESLKDELKDLKIDLKDLDKELAKLKAFMKELRAEMRKDGLIEDENEDINMELNKSEMEINGEKVPDELFQKYKSLYKKHFGKELEEGFQIHSN